MAVEMIGGPRLCEPLLATGLGRFTGAPRAGTLTALGKEHLPIGEAVGFQAHRNALRQLARNYFSALCLVAAVAFWL